MKEIIRTTFAIAFLLALWWFISYLQTHQGHSGLHQHIHHHLHNGIPDVKCQKGDTLAKVWNMAHTYQTYVCRATLTIGG